MIAVAIASCFISDIQTEGLVRTESEEYPDFNKCNEHVFQFFKGLANSNEFKDSIWEVEHKYFPGQLKNLSECLSFTMKNVTKVASFDLIRHSPANVFAGGGSSFTSSKWSDKILDPIPGEYIKKVLSQMPATFVVNKAGYLFPYVAELEVTANDVFGAVTNTNMYITKHGRKQSVAPHTDTQDIMIIQLAGTKQWSLFNPQILLAMTARGKGKDAMERGKDYANDPVLKVDLVPGDVLYIPRGMVHTTSTQISTGTQTIKKEQRKSKHSIHLTLGFESVATGTTVDKAFACAVMLGTGPEDAKVEVVAEIIDAADSVMGEPLLRGSLGGLGLGGDGDGDAAEVLTVQLQGALRALVDQDAGEMIAEAGLKPNFRRAAKLFLAHTNRLRRDLRFLLLESVASGISTGTNNEKKKATAAATAPAPEQSLQLARWQHESQKLLTSAFELLANKCRLTIEGDAEAGGARKLTDAHFAAAVKALRARGRVDEL
jgi:hypothetical protein